MNAATGEAAVFFVNERARGGEVELRLARLLRRHPDLHERSRVVCPRAPEEVFALARGLPRGVVAVAAGGDGTANLLARALRAARPGSPNVLAVVPLGTGNAFAHGLGIHSPDRALAAIREGHVIPLDVMRTSRSEQDMALVSISTGFEADFMTTIADRRARRGMVRSAGRALRCGFPGSRRGARLVADGALVLEETDEFYNAGLYGMPCYAFGWRVVPEAIPWDGKAELVLHVRARGYWCALATAMARLRSQGGRRRGWRRARFVSAGAFQVDGEALAGGELEVWVERHALVVVTGRPGQASACPWPRAGLAVETRPGSSLLRGGPRRAEVGSRGEPGSGHDARDLTRRLMTSICTGSPCWLSVVVRHFT
jgi:diacylglycerol kinase (ATP)